MFKLVRDRIPQIIFEATHKQPHIMQAQDKDMLVLLKAKLLEENEELNRADGKTHQAEELADILEVVYALGYELGIDRNELEEIRLKKLADRGGFTKGYILEQE